MNKEIIVEEKKNGIDFKEITFAAANDEMAQTLPTTFASRPSNHNYAQN